MQKLERSRFFEIFLGKFIELRCMDWKVLSIWFQSYKFNTAMVKLRVIVKDCLGGPVCKLGTKSDFVRVH